MSEIWKYCLDRALREKKETIALVADQIIPAGLVSLAPEFGLTSEMDTSQCPPCST